MFLDAASTFCDATGTFPLQQNYIALSPPRSGMSTAWQYIEQWLMSCGGVRHPRKLCASPSMMVYPTMLACAVRYLSLRTLPLEGAHRFMFLIS